MTLTPTNKLLLDLVREWGSDRITAKLHGYKIFRNLPAMDVQAWALGEFTPSVRELKALDTALPRIAESLRKKKRPRLAAPEMG